MAVRLFDTHTHFDVPDFDLDREQLAYDAKKVGVEHLILIGFLSSRFEDLARTQQLLQGLNGVPKGHLAPGLHPFYIEDHKLEHLDILANFLKRHDCIAIGEIGLDTFLKQHKAPEIYQKQKEFFSAQIDLAKQCDKPILLHIRKSHADVLAILKQHQFKHGGIAHAFGGGVEEAKAFIKLGFKIGITGQITNPNAKKLHDVVKAIGVEHLVLETDCPDMTPLCCQSFTDHITRNTPENLIYVLKALAQELNMSEHSVAEIVWQNSFQALQLKLE